MLTTPSLACRLCLDPDPLQKSPTLDFLGAQFFTLGIPALVVIGACLGLAKWADQILASLAKGRSRATGRLRQNLCLWLSVTAWLFVISAWLSGKVRWLDFGLSGLPLTWAAIFGPPLIHRHWISERQHARDRLVRVALLGLGVTTVAGWIYQIRSLTPI